jgi:hypothetical protein
MARGFARCKPADACLALLGSMQNRTGLVYCDSNLNLMKTNKLQDPVSDAPWNMHANSTEPESLERALAYIQTIMAVFTTTTMRTSATDMKTSTIRSWANYRSTFCNVEVIKGFRSEHHSTQDFEMANGSVLMSSA